MGYVFNFQDAQSYTSWWSQHSGHWTAGLELGLMTSLLGPAPGETILDIGCGIGVSARQMLDLGLQVTGIDPSPYMLDKALANLGGRVDLYRGFAEDLPFDDNSFNHAQFFISLEFVNDPSKAIAEAFRVAKDRVFLGFFNRYALKSIQNMLSGRPQCLAFDHARFFSVWEVKKMARSLAGSVPIAWRTACHLPGVPVQLLRKIERSNIVQQSPFGAFAGMRVTVVPKFRTRPLAMRYKPKTSTHIMPGSAPVGSTSAGRTQSRRV